MSPLPLRGALAAAALVLAGCLGAPPPAGPDGPADGAPDEGFANVLVTTRNGPASEVTVAANPRNPLNLVGGAKDYTLGEAAGCDVYNVWSGVYWSTDGGATWGNALMPGYPGDANTTLLSRYRCNSDPVVVFGSDGTAYYSGLAYGGAAQGAGGQGVCPTDTEAMLCGRSIWTARSTDGGATWDQFVNVAVSDDVNTILDKQWLAINPSDPRNLVMAWITFAHAAPPLFYIAASFDGAATWTPPVVIAEGGLPIHQFVMPAFGPEDDQVYVVWQNFGPFQDPGLPALPVGKPGTPQVMFARNLADSPAFTPAVGIAPLHPIQMDAEYRTNSLVSLAVDQASGAIYVVWPDDQGGQADIVFVKSTDGGETWTAPAVVNAPSEADQFMSWVAVGDDGAVNVVYYDRGYTPGNTLLDVSLARSEDGGATWRHLRVTPESWALPEGCYHQRGFPFLGDYIGLAAINGTLHPFWADGRHGRCDVYTAAIPVSAFAQAGEAAGEGRRA